MIHDMRIALIPLSAKPYHQGHHNLINTASNECNFVEIFISVATRENVNGFSMLKIWKEIIEKYIPKNCTTIYCKSPVRQVWERLGGINADDNDAEFLIYGGVNEEKNDTNRFGDEQLKKYVPELFLTGFVKRRPVHRNETNNVSGTLMRKLLLNGDKESFIARLSSFSRIDAETIWQILNH